MHSIGYRTNALLTFAVTVLALMCAIVSLSDNLNSPNPTAQVQVPFTSPCTLPNFHIYLNLFSQTWILLCRFRTLIGSRRNLMGMTRYSQISSCAKRPFNCSSMRGNGMTFSSFSYENLNFLLRVELIYFFLLLSKWWLVEDYVIWSIFRLNFMVPTHCYSNRVSLHWNQWSSNFFSNLLISLSTLCFNLGQDHGISISWFSPQGLGVLHRKPQSLKLY